MIILFFTKIENVKKRVNFGAVFSLEGVIFFNSKYKTKVVQLHCLFSKHPRFPWRLGRGCGICRTGRTRSKAGTWGVSPGAQVHGERDPDLAFLTLNRQVGTSAMAPNVAEFVDKIM